MGHRFAQIAFTDSVKEVQQALGSRAGYARMDEGEDFNHALTDRETAFIEARDSFYMASVSETGWPYVQHRGGPPGFVRVLDERTLGFADFKGNRQYVTVGNVRKDDRVSLLFMDYPSRQRLKLLGRVELIGPGHSALLSKLEVEDYDALVERGFLIHAEAFDWNCPQHITPRYTEEELGNLVAQSAEKHRAPHSEAIRPAQSGVSTLGEGPFELVVAGVRQLTPRVRAYELRDPQGGELPAVAAGSHIEVPIEPADGKLDVRYYSICSDPARHDAYEIAVLREDDGAGGSLAVHKHFNLGLHLRCGAPRNWFGLHADARPSVLIAGGIGITPIKAMAHALKRLSWSFELHYAGRSRREMTYLDQLLVTFEHELSVYVSIDGKRMDTASILSAAPADVVFYVCGPGRLIDEVNRHANALGIDPNRIRFERFTATVGAEAKQIDLELRRSEKRLEVGKHQTLLEAMLEAGIDAPFGCRAGNCKSCAVKVLEGVPDHRDSALSPFERDGQNLICICISRAKSGYLALDL